MEKRKLQPMMRAMVAMVLLLCAGMLNAAPVSYYLKIAGVEITSDNVNDIEGAVAAKGDGCEAHGVTYDPVKHELHLDNATIIAKGEGVSAIDTKNADYGNGVTFTIYIEGENTINSEYITLSCKDNLEIRSPGLFVHERSLLSIQSTGLSGIEMKKITESLNVCSLDVFNSDVAIESAGFCISSGGPDFFDMTLRSSSLSAATTNTDSNALLFKNLRRLQRTSNVYPVYPTESTWNSTLHGFYNGDTECFPKSFLYSGHLDFQDSEVERICLENWDANEDNLIDYMEVRKITSLGGLFKGNTTITSFYELQFFQGMKIVDSETFADCTSLMGLMMPRSVSYIYNDAFTNTAVEQITIGKKVRGIDAFAFKNCTALKTVLIDPESDLSTIGFCAFINAPITSLGLSSNLNTIERQAFYNNRLTTLTLPASVSSIGESAFSQGDLPEGCLTTIVVEGEIPATIGTNCFGETRTGYMGHINPQAVIYVPDGLVNTYKEAWPQYAAYIKSRVTYPIEIAGIRLAENNVDAETGAFSYNDGTGKRYVEGVRYVPSTHTLYLDDGNIIATSDLYNCGIYTDSDLPLHIVMTGNSQIVGVVGINTAAGFTIEGETVAAYLMISSQKAGVIGKNTGSTTPNDLVFKNCEVSIRTTDGPCINGYYCVDPDNPDDDEWGISPRMVGKLVCQKVNLELSAIGYNVVKRIGGYNQTDCHITYPTSGTFGLDLENGFMIDTGSGYQPVKDYFKIERNPESIVTGISELTEEGNSQTGTTEWYTLDGRKLNGEPVKSGIYLMNGRKVVVK
jgi:hypothetical protein